MQNEQSRNRTSALIDSLEQALTTADDLRLTAAAIHINQALIALGAQPPEVDHASLKRRV